MVHIGRLEGYGVGKEATRGTAVAPSIWVQQNEGDFDNQIDRIIDESASGVLMNSSESNLIKQFSTGEIGGILPSTSIGFFFLSILGTVTSAETSGGGAYEHDFSMNNVNNKQSLTISRKTPTEELQFALAMVESLSITANIGEAVMMKVGLRAKKGETASLTKAYTEDNKFYSHMINVKIATNLAGLDSADAECFENIELNLTQELEDGFCFTSGVDLGDIFNKAFSIDLTFGKKRTDNTYKTYVETDGLYKAMRIEMIDTSKTIGTSDNPTIQIDIARVSFDDHENDGGINDVMRETITAKGHYDLANGDDITIKVINELASY